MHKRLFIPGPVEVIEEIRQAMATPMIGHRGSEFAELYAEIQPKLQDLLYTQNPVFLFTTSAWGAMEAAVRNGAHRRCLNLTCGAFSDKWHSVTKSCGIEADALAVEWGKAIKPEMVEDALKKKKYDCVTLVHNETSTGVMNPLEEIAGVMRKFPDVMFCVDCVSSMAAVKVEMDRLGLDVCLASVQKAFALPPGFAVCAVSERMLEKSKAAKGKGYYFDFQAYLDSHKKNQTPTTPSIAHMFALNLQLDRILEEGLEARFTRHREMADYTRNWAGERFECFAEEGYRSQTITTVANTRNINVSDLNKFLGERGATIGDGYGKLKGKTFRIAHMGDHTFSEVKELLGWIDEFIGA